MVVSGSELAELPGVDVVGPTSVTEAAAVRVSGLSHAYAGGVQALRDVAFDVPAGSACAVVGPNGSGKTTLFSILSTQLRPRVAEGSGHADVSLHGENPWQSPAAVRRHLGVVFQHPSLDIKLTVEENLRYQAKLYGLTGDTLRERIETALESSGLRERRRDRAERLSGGMKRRLEIAKATLHRPAVLLLDEPDTGLDVRALREVWDQLDALRRQHGTTTLIATHRMDLAERCDRVVVLSRGRVAACDTPAGLRGSLPGGVVRVEADADRLPTIRDAVERLRPTWADEAKPKVAHGVVIASVEDPAAFAVEVDRTLGAETHRVAFGRATLEDVFLALTAED